MSATRLKIALLFSYVIFAMLLNSVGTVILQSIEYFHVDKIDASTLEGFKDIPIAVVSFLIASFLPRIGYRRGMMVGLGVVALACASMPLLDSFWATRMLFLAIGCSFAVVKVSVYAFVGLLTETPSGHASLLNVVEGVFMLGVLGGYWLFSAFLDAGNPASPGWLDVYWWIAGACALTIVLLASAPFDESRAHEAGPPRALAEDFTAMVKLAARPLTIVFIISVFLYVLIEQGIGTWLPTFNRQLLGLSAPMSVQAASIFALSLAAGRLAAGTIVRRTGWFRLLVGCLAAMAVLILVVLPLAESAPQRAVDEWAHAPIAAFLFPLIGLFMAPIYPAINSAVLSAMPRPTHAAMVGLLVVFSALGGTTGSFIIGRVFAAIEGAGAFYLLLIPVAGVFLALRQLKTLTEHPSASGAALAS